MEALIGDYNHADDSRKVHRTETIKALYGVHIPVMEETQVFEKVLGILPFKGFFRF